MRLIVTWPPPPRMGVTDPHAEDDHPAARLLEAVLGVAHRDANAGSAEARRFIADLQEAAEARDARRHQTIRP